MKCPRCNQSIEILDINDVARLRGNIKKRAVQLWCESGELPAIKFGNKWLILKSDLDNFEPTPVGRPRKSLR